MRITGGVAGNVVPDACEVEVNFRFAPDRTRGRRPQAHLREVFDGLRAWRSPTRRRARCPGWTRRRPREFLAAVGAAPIGKLGWTDVARFAALGIPALNFGPGDPNLAHTPDEHVEIGKIRDGAATLRRWLAAAGPDPPAQAARRGRLGRVGVERPASADPRGAAARWRGSLGRAARTRLGGDRGGSAARCGGARRPPVRMRPLHPALASGRRSHRFADHGWLIRRTPGRAPAP